METEASVTENPAMTFDEASMERSKSFVKALQVPSSSSISNHSLLLCLIRSIIFLVYSWIYDLLLFKQELKNLRPQLYSAADYCEKSYLHSEQKQMYVF